MQTFPHHYIVSLDWKEDRYGTLSAGPRPTLAGGPPPEFNGREEDWSPEHLLLAAAELCLMTTFMTLAKKKELPLLRFTSRITGTLERTNQGLAFTDILQEVDMVTAAGEIDRGRALLAYAEEHCLIANSLKPKIRLKANVTAALPL